MTMPIRFFLPFRLIVLCAAGAVGLFPQQNLVISGSHTSGTVPCQAVDTISTDLNNPFTASGSASVKCEAGGTIHLRTGFRATAGTGSPTFEAFITSMPVASALTSPAAGASGPALTPQTFTLTFSDNLGYSDINSFQVSFGGTGAVSGICSLSYSGGTLGLWNDNATQLLQTPPLQNSQCALGTPQVTGAGTTLTFAVPITFSTSFQGSQEVYALAVSSSGDYHPWVDLGAWTVTGPGTQTRIYSSAGTYTWTAPANVSSVQVEAWGPGGSGANSALLSGYYISGGGGGGGAYAKKNSLTVTPGQNYAVVVGAGGSATRTTFASTVVVADAGLNGTQATVYPTPGPGGSGGLASNSTGDVKESGTNGGNGGSPYGGNGGAGGNGGPGGLGGGFAPYGNGYAGTAPGGGGGGGASGSSYTGAAGGTGQVVLTYVGPPVATYTISGQVTMSGAGLAGVRIDLTGAPVATVFTDSNGNYSIFSVPGGGNYTITASKAGYTLSTPQTFTNLAANQTASFTAALTPFSVSTVSLPGGIVGSAYSQPLTVSGGVPGFTWSLAAGYLPPGLTLSSTGIISGTPTTAQTYPFTVRVTDAISQTATKALSITITVAPPPPVAAPTFNPLGATYTSEQSVTITTATSGASINYTTDGVTDPTPTTGTPYNAAIPVTSTTVIKAIAYKAGMTNSPVVSATYTIVPHYANPLAFTTAASVVAGVETGFNVTYASRAGVADIASGQVQIDACYFEWDNAGNVLLHGTGSIGDATGQMGQSAFLYAGSCSINLANSHIAPVTGNPDAVAITMAVSFPQQDFPGTHEVYAWGTNADGLGSGQLDLGALVVSNGQDFALNVTPGGGSSITLGPNSSVNLTITAVGLNGFTGNITLSDTVGGEGCFAVNLPSSISANSQTIVNIQNWCQTGAMAQHTFYGTANQGARNPLSHTASSTPVLISGPAGDFAVTVGSPSAPTLSATGSVSYPVTVQSLNGQNGNVTLSMSPTGMPAGVAYQFSPAQVYLPAGGSVSSTVTFTGSANTPGGTYPLTVTANLGTMVRTAAFSLGTQVTTFQVTSVTGSSTVLNTGQEVQITQNVPAINAPVYQSCTSPDPAVTCRVISSTGNTVTLGVIASRGAVHGTRMLRLNGGAATLHMAVADVTPYLSAVSPTSDPTVWWLLGQGFCLGTPCHEDFPMGPEVTISGGQLGSTTASIKDFPSDTVLNIYMPYLDSGSYDIRVNPCEAFFGDPESTISYSCPSNAVTFEVAGSPPPPPPSVVVTQSPTGLNVSTGDSDKRITTSVTPSSVSFSPAFSFGLVDKLNSDCATNLGFSTSSGSGSVDSTITAAPEYCGGVFVALAVANGRTSENSTRVVVPPQKMIQTLVGEAGAQTAPDDDTMPSVLLVAKNRFGDRDFTGGLARTWQAVLVPLEFYGATNTTPNGLQPELDYAAAVFAGTSSVSIPVDCKAYWSPKSTDFATLQTWASRAASAITDPEWVSVGAPRMWTNRPKQALIKSSIAKNRRQDSQDYKDAPAIVLFRLAPSGTNLAVITIP